jgi:hypothetical protein
MAQGMSETAAVRADLALQGLSARAGLHRRYFDAREWLRARTERRDLAPYRTQGVLFIHVPKCGGSSIEAQIGIFHGHRSATYFRYADPALFARLHKAALVRNPYDRLVSGFHYLKNHTTSARDQAWARATLGGIGDFAAFLGALEDPRFRTRVLHWLHFLPQWYFLCDRDGRLLVDELGRLEAFDAFAASLGRRLGLPLSAGVREKASNRGAYRAYYTPRGAALVREMYARDFEILSYEGELEAA